MTDQPDQPITTAKRNIPRSTISVILPAFNEAEALPTVIGGIRFTVPDAEIVVVDDASTDDTAAVAAALGCIVVRHEENRGKGAALRTGAGATTSDLLIFMDADATYPPEAIPTIVELLGANDHVRADRAIDAANTPWVNRVGNTLLERVLQALHGMERGDHLSGLYGFRRASFEALGTVANGFDIEVEIGIKIKERGLSTVSLPIEYRPRIGDKKLSPLKDGLHILGRILRLVLIYRPMLLFGLPGAALTLLSLIAAAFLSQGPIVTGYLGLSIHTFIVAALGVLAGFQLMSFGIAGAVYRRQLGYGVSQMIIRITSPTARAVMAVTGSALAVGCGVWLVITVAAWVISGGPEFTATRALVTAASGAVFGLQLLSASLFITMLSDRIE